MTALEPLGDPPAGRLLGNDLVINESACNLSCSYCLTGQSNLKAAHENQLIFQLPAIANYEKDEEFGRRLKSIVDRVDKKLAPPILKLTGGEIFIVKGIMSFIEEVASSHEAIIVQTNGLPLTDEKIDRLSALGNITVQISLDSSVYEGNSYRVQSAAIHEKVLERIKKVASSGLPLEIYGVLNDKSAPYLRDFVEWCCGFDDNWPQLFPFPVRGPDCESFVVRPDQHHYVEELESMLPTASHVLPPLPYLQRLTSFYRDGLRSWRCHLPRMVVSTFDDGVVTPCPNIWFHKMGDLTADDWGESLDKVNATPFYDLLLGERPRLNACKGCFTPWDTISLYFDDLITLDELCRAPSYAAPRVRELLASKKLEYVGH
jgi:MoaA/NifB/PqqE/SkfB family radical SAM enzyme